MLMKCTRNHGFLRSLFFIINIYEKVITVYTKYVNSQRNPQVFIYIFDSSKYPPFARITAAHILGILSINLCNDSVVISFQQFCRNVQSCFVLVGCNFLTCLSNSSHSIDQVTIRRLRRPFHIFEFFLLLFGCYVIPAKFRSVLRIIILLENESATHNSFPTRKSVPLKNVVVDFFVHDTLNFHNVTNNVPSKASPD